MGTTPTLLLPYPEPTDPADVPTDMHELADRIEAVRGAATGLASLDASGKVPAAQLPGGGISYGSTPPGSPADGDVWYLPVTAGVVWQFRYNAGAAGSFKWEFIGGPPFASVIDTDQTPAAANAWTTLPTLGPDCVVPRAGDYLADFACRVTGGPAASDVHAAVANASVNNNPVGSQGSASPLVASRFLQIAQHTAAPGLALGNTLRFVVFVTGGSEQIGKRTLRVTPVRVS